ncbi:MAG: citramalate synthase [Armatimonadetes bacterium CG07_land_8_20_14_0_80_40_9]|nr:MAG: citramalate synthase [Armatimonadetes bacterium CG07_land_8_20_14_0_80_40_9]
MNEVKIYDTTLRDGAQGEGIAFSVEDKLKIARRLDELKIHYIEGGWPGSNPTDIIFFQRIKAVKLENSKIVAFGSTRRPKISPERDLNLQNLLSAQTKTITIFGKSWDLHVIHALKVRLEENLAMIADSVEFLKAKGKEVIFDAEHFFDGYKGNPEYSLSSIKKASEAGADWIVLCDTNGGCLPYEIEEIIRKVKKEIKTPLGIHAHNDTGCAVANSISAVRLGLRQVQGTINGYGERCGNANLCTVIPNLKLKLGIDCLDDLALENLSGVSRYVSEIANLSPREDQPYVGNSAFAHKGGVHVSAVFAHPETYQHIKPELIGNRSRVLISELSGKSNILYKAQEYNIDLSQDTPEVKKILEELKKREHQGYQYEGAEASFELLIKKILGSYQKLFELKGFRMIIEKEGEKGSVAEATIKLKVKGEEEHVVAEGEGPVNALDSALRKALDKFYPQIKNIKLTDFKVRVINEKAGTAAKVRVLVESSDEKDKWGTVGVSENIIEASWQALVESIEYGLQERE